MSDYIVCLSNVVMGIYMEICHVSVAMTMLRSLLLHRKGIANENVSVDTVQ